MKQTLFKQLPKIDDLLAHPEIERLLPTISRVLIVETVREEVNTLRGRIAALTEAECENFQLSTDQLVEQIIRSVQKKDAFHLRRVVNGTGVVLHTNLGRACLSDSLAAHLAQVSTRYSTLEFDIDNGKRGTRYAHVEELLCRLTGAEAAMLVNNNAAAVLLVLNTLASGKEVIVSRGQMVEIGGAFRVPEVMKHAGASLVEIGTTNKTHLRDYEEAITEETGILLKVHTSNYRILGFTKEVEIPELAALGKKTGIPVVEDIGSGSFVDFSAYGMTKEPTVRESVEQGADVVTFSGDKMLGGPQAGIIVGKKEWIDRMKRNHLTRALRVDKMTLAALEATLRFYLDEEQALREIPTLRMLTMQEEELQKRAEQLLERIGETAGLSVDLQRSSSEVGGGSMPLEKLPTVCLVLRHDHMSAAAVQEALRDHETPVIVRVNEDKVWIDPRTIQDDEMEIVANALRSLV